MDLGIRVTVAAATAAIVVVVIGMVHAAWQSGSDTETELARSCSMCMPWVRDILITPRFSEIDAAQHKRGCLFTRGSGASQLSRAMRSHKRQSIVCNHFQRLQELAYWPHAHQEGLGLFL